LAVGGSVAFQVLAAQQRAGPTSAARRSASPAAQPVVAQIDGEHGRRGGRPYVPALRPEQEHALGPTPTDELLALAFLNPDGMGGGAYVYAKRGNHLRVQAESLACGERVNAISAGIIITSPARDEMSGRAPRTTTR
jgi:hypothetical protein